MKKFSSSHRAMAPVSTRRTFFHQALAGAALACVEPASAQSTAPEREPARTRRAEFDGTLAFLREGFLFIPNRCNEGDMLEWLQRGEDVL